MNKILPLIIIFCFFLKAQAQISTRIFYQLSYKPMKDSSKVDSTIAILDITDKFSLYRDFDLVSQDSLLINMAEKMHKSGVFFDAGKSIKWPKFTFKVKKDYINNKTIFIDGIFQKYFSYTEKSDIKWQILNETKKIDNYNVQKAITDLGGRKWVAWFSNSLPFHDGPYKFCGLPGLIISLHDTENNYSWKLVGLKNNIEFSELSFTEKISGFTDKTIEVTKEKFTKSYLAFRNDPFAEARLTINQKMRDSKMPGTEMTVGELLKNQEERVKKYFESNNNTIEIN